MYSCVLSSTLRGVQGVGVSVEADVSSGLPVFDMVGYLGFAVREARERVRTALRNSGFVLPPRRITVNLSPAELHKEGSGFDLAIAIAVLVAAGMVAQEATDGCLVLGELGLNGEVRPVRGVLPMVSHAYKSGVRCALVPTANAREGAIVEGMQVYGVSSLQQAVAFFTAQERESTDFAPAQVDVQGLFARTAVYDKDFCEVVGQDFARRAMEIAAAGFHNSLLIGPPGSGKSMLAQRLPSILPPLTLSESIELTNLYSVKGLLAQDSPLLATRPFRAPHHTLSTAALAGGGAHPAPGELSLAHKGVLFLDELPEFKREVIEVLRQPLEERQVSVSRMYAACTFPCDVMLVAAMNPCPCGYYPDRQRCRCTPGQIRRYLSRISQPLLDRIDLCVQVQTVSYGELTQRTSAECSAAIRMRVERAQQRQRERYHKLGICFNAQLSHEQLKRYCTLNREGERFLEEAMERFHFSARTYHRILRVARTIADLADRSQIDESHLYEAVAYHNGNLSQLWEGLD